MDRLISFLLEHWVLASAFILLLVLLLQTSTKNVIQGISILNPEEVVDNINHQQAVVVDLRSEEKFSAGHIINAINIPQQQLENQVKKLSKYKSRPIIVVDETDQAAAKSANILLKHKFQQAHAVKGGMSNWQSAEMPVTKL